MTWYAQFFPADPLVNSIATALLVAPLTFAVGWWLRGRIMDAALYGRDPRPRTSKSYQEEVAAANLEYAERAYTPSNANLRYLDPQGPLDRVKQPTKECDPL